MPLSLGPLEKFAPLIAVLLVLLLGLPVGLQISPPPAGFLSPSRGLPPPSGTILFQGTITDCQSGAPIGGASVSIQGATSLLLASTNGQGYYAVNGTSAGMGGSASYSVSAPGYQSASASVTFGGAAAVISQNFKLLKTSSPGVCTTPQGNTVGGWTLQLVVRYVLTAVLAIAAVVLAFRPPWWVQVTGVALSVLAVLVLLGVFF